MLVAVGCCWLLLVADVLTFQVRKTQWHTHAHRRKGELGICTMAHLTKSSLEDPLSEGLFVNSLSFGPSP